MRITIDNTGQTVTLNPPYAPDRPDDSLQRITDVYFAKKVVTRNGAHVAFTRIDSAHTQQDAAGQVIAYDSILGKTVYLIIETNNMATLSVDAVIKPSNNTMTGNTDSLRLMKFNGTTQLYEATTLLTAEVGNLDALNNRDGSHAHYTNAAADFANKCIIKLQLKPETQALFNTWATNIAAATVNLEVVVERTDNLPVAFGPNSTTEVNGAEVFLNTATTGRFRIVNKNFYEIYARIRDTTNGPNANSFTDSPYNFFGMHGTVRKKIKSIVNASSTSVVYFYFDRYDNEMLVTTCEKTNVMGRENGVQLGAVPPRHTSRTAAPEGGNAQFNYHYANGSIVTTGNHRNGPRERLFPGQERIVQYNASGTNIDLVRMPDSLNINQNGVRIAFRFSGSQRRFCNPECFAAFIGILAEVGIAGVTSTGMCFGDATSYPSLSHPNGDSIDTGYLVNQNVNQQKLLDAFVGWSFTEVIAGTAQQQWLNNAHRYRADHDSHLHSGNFDSNSIEPLY
jgi:hypothetical protein